MTTRLRRVGVRADFPHLITVACVALYVLALLMDPSAIFQTRGMMSFLAPSGEASFKLGMTGAYPVFRYGHWWTVVTAIYLHGGLLHIFFNTMWVRQLGPLVGQRGEGGNLGAYAPLGGSLRAVVSPVRMAPLWVVPPAGVKHAVDALT